MYSPTFPTTSAAIDENLQIFHLSPFSQSASLSIPLLVPSSHQTASAANADVPLIRLEFYNIIYMWSYGIVLINLGFTLSNAIPDFAYTGKEINKGRKREIIPRSLPKYVVLSTTKPIKKSEVYFSSIFGFTVTNATPKLQIDGKKIKKGSRGYKQDHYLITFQWLQLTQIYMHYGGMIFTWVHDKTSTFEHKYLSRGGEQFENHYQRHPETIAPWHWPISGSKLFAWVH